MTFTHRRFKSYSPGRIDARKNEAAAFLKVCRDPAQVSLMTFKNQFNLKTETAETLLKYEVARRGGN